MQSPLSVGQFAGKWCSYNAPPDLPYDQREEDGGSLIFDGERPHRADGDPRRPGGAPRALRRTSRSRWSPSGSPTSRPTAGPPASATGCSTSPTARATTEPQAAHPRRALPGRGHAQRHGAGDPAWPSPAPRAVDLLLAAGLAAAATGPADRLPRPQRAGAAAASRPRRRRAAVPALGEPEGARPLATTQLEPARHRWTVTRDLVDYESALEVVKDLGVVRFDDIDLDVTRRAVERYSWVADDVTSVRGETTWSMGFARGDWKVRTETRTVLTSTETNFRAPRPARRLRGLRAGVRAQLAAHDPPRPRLTTWSRRRSRRRSGR